MVAARVEDAADANRTAENWAAAAAAAAAATAGP